MLIARRDPRSRQALGWAALASVVLHAGVLATLLITAERRGVLEPLDAKPMVELVMVEQKGSGQDAAQAPPTQDQATKPVPTAPSAAAPPTPAPVPPAPQPPAVQTAPPPAQPPPPTAQADTVMLPPPPPPTPAPPSAAPPPPPQLAAREAPPRPPVAPAPATPAPPAPKADATPTINLGGTDSLSNVLVTGDDVIPAGIDSKVHNREPVYPDEAVRRGEQGTVALMILVSPEGLPSEVDVTQSSGFAMLDRAARDAVATWRFMPAVRDGQPIESTMPVHIVFQLN